MQNKTGVEEGNVQSEEEEMNLSPKRSNELGAIQEEECFSASSGWSVVT